MKTEKSQPMDKLIANLTKAMNTASNADYLGRGALGQLRTAIKMVQEAGNALDRIGSGVEEITREHDAVRKRALGVVMYFEMLVSVTGLAYRVVGKPVDQAEVATIVGNIFKATSNVDWPFDHHILEGLNSATVAYLDKHLSHIRDGDQTTMAPVALEDPAVFQEIISGEYAAT